MMYISEVGVAVEPVGVPVSTLTVSEVGSTAPLPVLSEATA